MSGICSTESTPIASSRRIRISGYLEHLESLEAMQRNYFGDSAASAFGDDNAIVRANLRRAAIAANASLSAEEKQIALSEIESDLPAEIRQAQKDSVRPGEVETIVQEMRDANMDESEIDAYRATEFGTEAVARFRALDESRAQTNAQLQAYRDDRDRRLAQTRSAAESAQVLREVRDEYFSGAMRQRIEALDALEAQRGAAGQ
ncbi:MAG: lipase secretion chaperone [Polyangiales bacterium]